MSQPMYIDRLLEELSYRPSGLIQNDKDLWRYEWHVDDEQVVVTYSEAYFNKEGQEATGCRQYEMKQRWTIPTWLFQTLFQHIERDVETVLERMNHD